MLCRKHIYLFAYINSRTPNQFEYNKSDIVNCEAEKKSDGVPFNYENILLYDELSNSQRDFWT